MNEITRLFNVIEATIGPDGAEFGYSGSPIHLAYINAKGAVHALNNGRKDFARRCAIKIARFVAEGVIDDATRTLNEFATAICVSADSKS